LNRSKADIGVIQCELSKVEIGYDTSAYKDTEKKCRRLEARGKGPTAERAGGLAADVRSNMARVEYEAADLYRRLGRKEAALWYYKLTAGKFGDTQWGRKATTWAAKLSGK
jgi:hypothetical protein